jgi:hypothetical protein
VKKKKKKKKKHIKKTQIKKPKIKTLIQNFKKIKINKKLKKKP